MILNEAGKAAEELWFEIPRHYPNVILHEHIVMPNHVHGIIELMDKFDLPLIKDANVRVPDVGVQDSEPLHQEPLPVEHLTTGSRTSDKINEYQKIIPGSIGSIIRGYKIGVVKWFRSNTDIYVPWQRNFHDHIIRNEEEYNRITGYISTNPDKWTDDKFYKA